MRVRSWYARGELAPQPELSLWELHPERMLSELSEVLRKNKWRPDEWLQVPYPKQGQKLRHYLKPTVRDQVAFMAHMVAIGPILDSQTENFAFGNRWYRPIAWDRRKLPDQRRWIQLRYPILNENTYLPYPRSHGLFRRVAHWTVAHMTRAPLSGEDEPNRRPKLMDYANEMLPAWTRQPWWNALSNDSNVSAYWTELDIELAFPSVRLDRLEQALERQLINQHPQTRVPNLLEGYPDTLVNSLDSSTVRVEIGRRLIKALRRIKVKQGVIPTDVWQPPRNHPLPKVSTDTDQYDGLPTGLIISGLLLNVVLQKSDRRIRKYLEQTCDDSPSAFLRFADDMYVFSSSRNGLFALIEEVHRALSGLRQSDLAKPNRVSNLCINLKKIKPKEVRELVHTYLRDSGWNQCEDCKQPVAPSRRRTGVECISDWLNSVGDCDDTVAQLRKCDNSALRQGDIGPFVTSLVERMSDIGRDTLRQRFGEGAKEYLARLHELARFQIDDRQVRPDTLRMFSINRLVRAWLPRQQDDSEEQRELRLIRQTLSFTIGTMPWKFSAWRAIVRGAARRPKIFKDSTEENKWLVAQISRIAYTTDGRDSTSWLQYWPEVDEIDAHAEERGNCGQTLYVSYLRAAFWQALASVIRELRRHAEVYNKPSDDSLMPLPHFWTVRSVPEGRHNEVADSLSQLDKWVRVLYPNYREMSLEQWPWELDEFVKCVLTVHPMGELTNAWQPTDDLELILKVPQTQRLRRLQRTLRVIRNSKRLQRKRSSAQIKLCAHDLAQIRFGHADEKFESLLFPTNGTSLISKSAVPPSDTLAIAHNFSCVKRVSLDLAQRVLPSRFEATKMFSQNVLKFQDYIRARRVIVGQQATRVKQPTIHRLLWGSPSETPLAQWKMIPWESPAIGLPIRVATSIFLAARVQSIDSRWTPKQGPLTWQVDDTKAVLANGRRNQFEQVAEPPNTSQNLFITKSTKWEIPPNVAFYRPFLVVEARDVHVESYHLYCDVLILLTMLDGDERILDRLASRGVGGTPFEDRWAWRARIHIPRNSWRLIEKILRWSDKPTTDIDTLNSKLTTSLKRWSRKSISWQDFQSERIDVGLDPRTDLDIVRAISTTGKLSKPNLPKDLTVDQISLENEMLVRVGQTNAWPDKTSVVNSFPHISSESANEMIEQVCNVFLAPTQTTHRTSPGLVVLPELAIPQQEIQSLRSLVKSENKGVVAGLYWRYVKSAFKPSMEFTPSRRYIVNELELVLPIQEERGPSLARWFRVQKPTPAHVEVGLARAISKKSANCSILSGKRWYRFIHPEWGDFSVGICSDLIDSEPWRLLRGELLHLFLVAFNKDVELFDSLTWIRAYENYVNVASVNHGKFGGSFIWTPKSKQMKELARLRGNNLVLIADVRMPVKSLFEVQKDGVEKAIERESALWLDEIEDSSAFKSPPPGYRIRD